MRRRPWKTRPAGWHSTIGTVFVMVALAAAGALVWLGGCGPSLLPETGEAFASQRTAQPMSDAGKRSDPCELVIGPMQEMCRDHGAPATSRPAQQRDGASDGDESSSVPSRPQVALLAFSALGLGGVLLLARRGQR
ncbi:hypothetical protein [Streptomyces smyrnaeus]|uniref:MYXO-CTERM domain-containing protein n=1 Tax=Streptomyces smyrnaeus TaxID=1387713 RepID=A0ABS3Y6D5_9ACTN|nr:hypothetical protein [Streptomyces smyrnaeus]MBO8203154.1 hypothetical protein [Streptomyces smyrnaeus]